MPLTDERNHGTCKCGSPATYKVVEEITSGDHRHPLTACLCGECFMALMGSEPPPPGSMPHPLGDAAPAPLQDPPADGHSCDDCGYILQGGHADECRDCKREPRPEDNWRAMTEEEVAEAARRERRGAVVRRLAARELTPDEFREQYSAAGECPQARHPTRDTRRPL